jgi:putative membrane-bound dehydrogenase-like protein
MLRRLLLALPCCIALLAVGDQDVTAQGKKEVIPNGQSQPPGPPLSPAEAIKKMQVPPGFHVELVASEPNLVNPVAMTFDEKGRIWITESVEYPRHSAGPGKDRVKLFESTKGDGNYDKVTTVIEGLNIPSGIAVGHGGVWVANSPDILFYPFEDRDTPKLGKPKVVVTGFGRSDTHELPNSLTWGPDGYLYGLNGVFNPSVVVQDGKEWRFTCAMFRIHPRTKKFDLFCEGTSNPWGIAFNENGDAFVSACVIDHLWHLTETGYYHRQGGPYPPHTWKIESIVKHRHQKAAYCGLCCFDSDAYPPEYRGKLYMGNIHGNCINSDELTRDGSTYLGKPRPDFLTANDAWFMPVAQKVGPDGCLYLLDWYDRYHCYQDAGRDPAGIDRLRGRLYRVVYKDYRPAGPMDLGRETDAQLIERLRSPNVYVREMAQRLLSEKFYQPSKGKPDVFRDQVKLDADLHAVATSPKESRTTRLHAWWALIGSQMPPRPQWRHGDLLKSDDPTFRAWGVRAVVNMPMFRGMVPGTLGDAVYKLAQDPAPEVQLQVAIAARRVKNVTPNPFGPQKTVDPLPVLLDVLAHCGNDKLIPHIVWQNLHPLLEERSSDFLQEVAKLDLKTAPAVAAIMPRAVERILAARTIEPKTVAGLVIFLGDRDRNACATCLAGLATKIQNGEVAGGNLDALRNELRPALVKFVGGPNTTLATEASLLAATLRDTDGLQAARQYFTQANEPESVRLKALAALVAARDHTTYDSVGGLLAKPKETSALFRGKVLAALSKLDEPRVADVVLDHFGRMEPELQPKAIDLLTERASWSTRLLGAIAAKKIAPSALNVNQVRKLLASKDAALVKQVTAVWGTLRTDRNPEREQLVGQMRDLIKKTPGDAHRGALVFKKVCAQCHKIYGEGVDVGPDVTSNGRSDFEQLLSNVFDPSLVIGAGYQATTVITNAGQVLTGLVVEESPQRVVLKVQGGEVKTVPRGTIDEINVSKVSLMPEGLERQLQPQEIADLFAYLCLDRPPTDPKARKIPGTPR